MALTPALSGAGGMPTATQVAERADAVRERIRGAGGSVAATRIVAVTKGFGPEAVSAAVGAGLVDVGENYADELVAKDAAVGDRARARLWHFLGRVQRNKVGRLAPLVAWWHGVDRVSAGREVARRAPGARVLVQVNVSGDATRNGCSFEAVPALVDDLSRLDLEVVGLMAVGPPGPPEAARAGFRGLAAMRERLGLSELSMGMTGDLEVAVQEGTTMLRLGRALFGERPPAAQRRQEGRSRFEIPRIEQSGPGGGDRLERPRRRV